MADDAIPADAIPDDLIRPREAARLVKTHISSIYRWKDSGRLRSWRRGGTRYLVSKADVLALLEPVEGTPRPVKLQVVARDRGKEARDRRTDEILRAAGIR